MEGVVTSMQEIVQEMFISYWYRINSSMLRFADIRLSEWNVSDAISHPENRPFVPVMGAGETVYIKRTEVTNADYAAFIDATGHNAPSNWNERGDENYPVSFITFEDAQAYCQWLTDNDSEGNLYRMPNESEWELAAGHMPRGTAFKKILDFGKRS